MFKRIAGIKFVAPATELRSAIHPQSRPTKTTNTSRDTQEIFTAALRTRNKSIQAQIHSYSSGPDGNAKAEDRTGASMAS